MYFLNQNILYPKFTNRQNSNLNFQRKSLFQTQPIFEDNSWFSCYRADKENSEPKKRQFHPITIKIPDCEINTQNSKEQYSKMVKRKYDKKMILDKSEYVPNQKVEEKTINITYLNEFRNILPNTIHQILSYIQRKNKSKKVVQSLISKYNGQSFTKNQFINDEICVSRFYAYQHQLKNRLSNYVTLQTFKFICTEQYIDYDSSIFSIDQQKIYNKICRTAILYYLKYEVVCVLMSSKRMQADKKREHLKINRKIQASIRSGLKEQQKSKIVKQKVKKQDSIYFNAYECKTNAG